MSVRSSVCLERKCSACYIHTPQMRHGYRSVRRANKRTSHHGVLMDCSEANAQRPACLNHCDWKLTPNSNVPRSQNRVANTGSQLTERRWPESVVAFAGRAAARPVGARGTTSATTSSWNRKRVVRRFADPGAQIPSPSTRITAVHNTGDETKLLCHVAAILANVVSAGRGVLVHEFVNVAGFGKDVGCVPELRDFG